jgi:hypothetical protein
VPADQVAGIADIPVAADMTEVVPLELTSRKRSVPAPAGDISATQ